MTVLVVLAVAEGAARIGLWLLHADRWEGQQRMLAASAETETDLGEQVHPFVGGIYDPTDPPNFAIGGKPTRYNRLGFAHPTEPVQKRSLDRYIIGVTGGSVAWQFCYLAGDRLIEHLQRVPELSDREIVLVCLASTGYKQPQQLMSVNFVLSLGGEFDLLVNLDGFNEVAVGEWCYRQGISPIYPRVWAFNLPFGHDRTALADHFQLWAARAERQCLAREIRDSRLRWSALRQLWWKVRDTTLKRSEEEKVKVSSDASLRELLSFVRNGPQEAFSSDAQMYARLVEIWSDSSRAMHALASGLNCEYIHCLQPNQYDAGSKRLSAEELNRAYNPESDYRPSVENGYPLLRAEGARLREASIRFHDLTQMFQEHPETIYSDDCCHVIEPANVHFADVIAAIIVDELFD